MRSRTGCQTCRQRKLKCDEVKPECGQCRKANRECHPSDGVVFRHQQNASMNSGEEKGERSGRLGSFFAYRNTFNDNNIWVDVPKNITFLNITDPFNMEPTPEPEVRSASTPIIVPRLAERSEEASTANFDQPSGLEALSAAATSNLQYNSPFLNPAQSPGGASISQHSNNINFILNPAGPVASPPIDPALTSSPRGYPFPTTEKEVNTVSDREVAFLLRHFGETAGQWMDLFDLGCYFAHQVPVQAMSNALLRYSACAYAAKQLWRVGGKKAIVGGNVSRQAGMESLYENPESVDWIYIAAKYYDRAISLLMEELSNSNNHEGPVSPITEDAYSPRRNIQSPHGLPVPDNKRRRLSRPASYIADETLAAAAILCVYEFLDNANSAWARHLSGTKSLFDLAEKEGMMPIQSPTSPGAITQRIKPSTSRKATFWNFARQDFLAAFINEGQTRLNTEDWSIWRAAGLLLDDQGFVVPSNTDDYHLTGRPLMREDMISNALIWLMSKIVNYTASGDSIDNVFPQDKGSPNGVIGINQMTLLERWRELEKELDIWYQGLPDTFTPCARLPPVSNGSISNDSPRAIFSEIWYSMPMCASTMQSYHFARILLLVNRPHESTARRSTLANRLHSYRSIEAEVRHHSHEICGIALGRPEGSVRIHQVQALFVAGQCLTETRERRVVLGLLREIESDLGWATDYRIQQLLKEWGWTSDPNGQDFG